MALLANPRLLRARRAAWPAALALLLAATLPARAQPGVSRVYEIKAAFLFHFAQFVRWPPSAFAAPDAPLRIGILGDDPFDSAIDEIVRGETIRGHPLAVRRSRSASDLRDCQIVFVSRSERDRLAGVFGALGSRPILTVGDTPGFADRGGIVNFYESDGRIRFEVNPDRAVRVGLKISSEMLSVCTIVRGGA